MIVDSHVHLKHGDADKTEYSAQEIVRVMDAVGIDRSVVFAMSTTTRRSIEMAREAVEQYPQRLIPYAYALPSYERAALDELDGAVTEYGFRGIKIHAGECSLAEYIVDPVIALAGRRGVPCLIDCLGRDRPVERMARTYPETTVIVAHLGKYLCEDETLIDRFIGLAETYPSLILDLSGVVLPGKIVEAAARIGADRLVFGTDGPHEAPDTVGYARAALGQIRELGLAPGDPGRDHHPAAEHVNGCQALCASPSSARQPIVEAGCRARSGRLIRRRISSRAQSVVSEAIAAHPDRSLTTAARCPPVRSAACFVEWSS
jgi:predicted TIM-barrel fold metal-dependent hydrolase